MTNLFNKLKESLASFHVYIYSSRSYFVSFLLTAPPPLKHFLLQSKHTLHWSSVTVYDSLCACCFLQEM